MNRLHWNHNEHYHPLVLDRLPSRAARALDIGCGEGLLATSLAARCDTVLAVDSDGPMVSEAVRRVPANVTVRHQDALDVVAPAEGFDVITSVASLHHLAHQVGLDRALVALRDLVAPGGTLVVLGLHRQPAEPVDFVQFLVARPLDLLIGAGRLLTGGAERQEPDAAPMPVRPAGESLPEIRDAASRLLPGAEVRRLLFWRYLLAWTAPG